MSEKEALAGQWRRLAPIRPMPLLQSVRVFVLSFARLPDPSWLCRPRCAKLHFGAVDEFLSTEGRFINSAALLPNL